MLWIIKISRVFLSIYRQKMSLEHILLFVVSLTVVFGGECNFTTHIFFFNFLNIFREKVNSRSIVSFMCRYMQKRMTQSKTVFFFSKPKQSLLSFFVWLVWGSDAQNEGNSKVYSFSVFWKANLVPSCLGEGAPFLSKNMLL